MSMDADALVDRRRLRRKVSFWRVVAALVAIIGLVGIGLMALPNSTGSNQIARVEIGGIITGDKPTRELLKLLSDDSSVKGVVLSIDSPGGTVTGSEALYLAIREMAAKKPTVAVIENVGASGAYIAALGTDRIIARSTAVVGSIGVVAQIPNATRLLNTVGIDVESVRSSPLKAMPSGIEPTPPAARAALEAMVLDNFDWFKGLVRERRKLDEAGLTAVADGRVFTGRQALPLKLIDSIGDEEQARRWFEADKGLAPRLPIVTRKPKADYADWGLLGSASAILDRLGYHQMGMVIREITESQALAKSTSIMYLWQP
jgi:protease IV